MKPCRVAKKGAGEARRTWRRVAKTPFQLRSVVVFDAEGRRARHGDLVLRAQCLPGAADRQPAAGRNRGPSWEVSSARGTGIR